MPSWWGKSSKEDKKKPKEGIIDALQRKLKTALEEKSSGRSVGSWRRDAERGTRSRVPSRSPSPSTKVSRCQSFAERSLPLAQPLPLPGKYHAGIGRSNSGISASTRPGLDGFSKSLNLPLPRPGCIASRLDHTYADGDVATASVTSDSSTDSEYPSDSRILSPLTSDYENGNRTTANSPSSLMYKEPSPLMNQMNSKESLEPADFSLSRQIPSASPRWAPLSNHVHNLQIPNRGPLCSAPDSSMSSPSRSPMRAFGSDQVVNYSLWAGLGSGQCSSPGSGHNSGNNSIGGDMSGQLFWPNSRCSPECSPIPSPRITSPGPSSRIQSGAVTPLHPRAGGANIESPTSRNEDGKKKSHRLPLPPITISNTCPFSPAYSTATSPSLPRSPNRPENPLSPASRWKKGRLLGRGTFGHVYLGFNSESGEMCAMKEVTLFSDDPKSKECAQQLGQEIALLSRLRHPNIVQYYGSETVDDKLYIYLEYVSGGSIYKLLQEYGQFGEIIIRSYTQQILSGLAYLHAKKTVHRDVKGANILVDPSGRVKLADFGMAKHITGQSCPLSFKGSPYWMAPEVVIRNSNGSNLAVDIWSLGCTVLEMATTKPPWSQFEGVAAIFKIGNSKELPAIPDSLSADGKDFVKRCLQRDPSQRPTASQLLEHPFVKNVAPLEKTILTVEPAEVTLAAMNGGRSTAAGHTRTIQGFELGVASHQSRVSKAGAGCSEAHSPKYMSCPVSPVGSPLLRSRSPQRLSGRLSPSPISSPHTASGSSTPLTGGSGAIPFHHSMQPAATYLQESMGMIPRSQNVLYANNSNLYPETMPDLFRGMSQPSHVFPDFISPDNNSAPENQFGLSGHGEPRELYSLQPVLADRVSQQLLRDHVKLKPSLHLSPTSPMNVRTAGI